MTWLNLVLGPHQRAFALGSPDLVYRMRGARDGYFDPDDTDILCPRYEDLVAEPLPAIQRIGRYLSLAYGPEALRLWEQPHHIFAGDQGTIVQVKRGQGLETVKSLVNDHLKGRENRRLLIWSLLNVEQCCGTFFS